MGLINQAALAEVQAKIKKLKPDCLLVAVTKTQPFEALEELYQLGLRDFGENRLEELQEKALRWQKEFPSRPIRWHFIGNFQSNKASKLLQVPGLAAIHSLSNLGHLQAVAKRLGPSTGESLQLFLQVNTSHEDEKSGFADDPVVLREALDVWKKQTEGSQVAIAGLMTMATLRTQAPEAEAKRCFSRLKSLAQELEAQWGVSGLKLSMGMSGDYLIALEEGSHLLRIGSLLFN